VNCDIILLARDASRVTSNKKRDKMQNNTRKTQDTSTQDESSNIDSNQSIIDSAFNISADDLRMTAINDLCNMFMSEDESEASDSRSAEIEIARIKNFMFDSTRCTRRNNDVLINSTSVKTSQTAQSLSIIMLSASMTQSLCNELDYAKTLLDAYDSAKLSDSDVFDFTVENALVLRATRLQVKTFLRSCLALRQDFESMNATFKTAQSTRFTVLKEFTRTKNARSLDSASIAE